MTIRTVILSEAKNLAWPAAETRSFAALRMTLLARSMTLVALLLAACASKPPPAPAPAPAPAEQHGHHMLVHRFEHADEWAPKFDDPTRDARIASTWRVISPIDHTSRPPYTCDV